MCYNFMLIMCNTGMRPPEAKNLRWRDVTIAKDRDGREIVVMFPIQMGKSEIETKVAEVKKVAEGEDVAAIKSATDSLGQVIQAGTSSVGGGSTILKMADLSKVRARALLVTALGNSLPALPKPGRYFGQDWALAEQRTANYGITAKAALGG